MKRYNIALCSLFLTGCSIFGSNNYEYTNPSAYEVARHNYNIIESAVDYGNMYLLVNEEGDARPRDLALYINQLLEPLGSNKITLKALIDYNRKVMAELKKND